MANASIYAAFERMWQHIAVALGTKVDKVDGKDLSSNDYTDEDKNKLNNIESLIGDTSVADQITEATSKVLPSVTEADNGKFMTVVDGVWAAEAIPEAEEASF